MIKSITIHLQEQKYNEKGKSKRNRFSKKKQDEEMYDFKRILNNNMAYWASLKTKIKKKKKVKEKVEEELVVAETQFELNVMFKQEEAVVNPVSAEEKLTNLATNIEEEKAKNKEEADTIQAEIEE